jgi:hypothetical protein
MRLLRDRRVLSASFSRLRLPTAAFSNLAGLKLSVMGRSPGKREPVMMRMVIVEAVALAIDLLS